MAALTDFLHNGLTALERETDWPPHDAGYALPRGSLDFLRACVQTLGVRRVFEFGSGASTRMFLEKGCELTSVENDRHWLEQTLQAIPEPGRAQPPGGQV